MRFNFLYWEQLAGLLADPGVHPTSARLTRAPETALGQFWDSALVTLRDLK